MKGGRNVNKEEKVIRGKRKCKDGREGEGGDERREDEKEEK